MIQQVEQGDLTLEKKYQELEKIIQRLKVFCYANGCTVHEQNEEFELFALKYKENTGQVSYIYLCKNHFNQLNSNQKPELTLIDPFSKQEIEGPNKMRSFQVNRKITLTKALQTIMKNACCSLMVRKYINLKRLQKIIISYDKNETLQYLKEQKLNDLEQRKQEYQDIIEMNQNKQVENKFYTLQYYKRLQKNARKINQNENFILKQDYQVSGDIQESDMLDTLIISYSRIMPQDS